MCIFCDIVAGRIPAYKVLDSKLVLAFLDIHPVSRGHVLVIPKRHYANLEEMLEEDLAAVSGALKKIGGIIKERLGVPAYNVLANNGLEAGQDVFHLHFHIIPRFKGDGLEFKWSSINYSSGEAEALAQKLLV